jgi:hypothetical protein
LLTKLGMKIDYESKNVTWDKMDIPMAARSSISDRNNLENLYDSVVMTDVIKDAEEHHRRILDADYAKVDIDSFCSTIEYLSTEEQCKLSDVLHHCPSLFQEGLVGVCKA